MTRGAGSSTVTGVNGAATAGVGTDTLINIEMVRGTNFADTYNATGFVGFNDFQGMGGNDSEKRLNYYRRHGVPEAQVDAFRGRGNHYRQLVPSVAQDFRASVAGLGLPSRFDGDGHRPMSRAGAGAYHDDRRRIDQRQGTDSPALRGE